MSIELFRFEFWVVGIEKLGFCVMGMHTAVCCFCNTAIFGSFMPGLVRDRDMQFLRYGGMCGLAYGLKRDRGMANLAYRGLCQIMGIFLCC